MDLIKCNGDTIDREKANINRENANNKGRVYKETNERYDEIIDNILPDHLHRGDTTTVNRLLGYTDAMMATCATFLILPLRNLKEMHKGQTLEDFVHEQRMEIIIFFLGFLIICNIWETINVRCLVIKRLDDILVLLSIVQMLATTILPFSLSLQGHYPKEEVSMVTTTIVLAIIEILDICIVFYSFAYPKLIHYSIRQWPEEDKKKFRFVMLLKPVINLILICLSGVFSMLDYRVSIVLVSLLILTPLMRKVFLYLRRHHSAFDPKNSCDFFIFYSKGNLSKERVEAFTDAAVAIIACVLILDLTVEEFPKKSKVEQDGLLSVLQHMQHEFFIFFGTYGMVSLLWYVNHTVIHLFHTINIVVLYLQKLFLAFLCFSPLIANMLQTFSPNHDENSAYAIRFSSGMIFASSICMLLMILWGYNKEAKFLHKWASKYHVKHNKYQHLYVLLKTANFPFWTFVSLIGSFGSGRVPRLILWISFTSCYIGFVIFKLKFLKHNRNSECIINSVPPNESINPRYINDEESETKYEDGQPIASYDSEIPLNVIDDKSKEDGYTSDKVETTDYKVTVDINKMSESEVQKDKSKSMLSDVSPKVNMDELPGSFPNNSNKEKPRESQETATINSAENIIM